MFTVKCKYLQIIMEDLIADKGVVYSWKKSRKGLKMLNKPRHLAPCYDSFNPTGDWKNHTSLQHVIYPYSLWLK